MFIISDRRSVQRIRHRELLAYPYCGGVLYFFVTWHGAGSLCSGIIVNAVFRPFTKKPATMGFKMTDEVGAFQSIRP